MKLLNWNSRGLNSSTKRHRLRDMIIDNHIDLIAIQETKKESFTKRCLSSISSNFDVWFWVPSSGRSGGILFGADSSQIKVSHHSLHRFCLNVILECKNDNAVWQLS